MNKGEMNPADRARMFKEADEKIAAENAKQETHPTNAEKTEIPAAQDKAPVKLKTKTERAFAAADEKIAEQNRIDAAAAEAKKLAS